MYVFKKKDDLAAYLKANAKDKTIGFTPTMGDLHHGHISLIDRSIAENDISICSIFVNPTQFNQSNDFDNYPQVLESDILTLQSTPLDIIFAPSVDEIYPEGKELKVPYPIGKLEHHIEGEHRPGHFQGVCQVVHRLLEIVEPNKLYVGEKDYQQVAVLERLIEIENLDIETVSCSIIREEHGLAMSSRNGRLSKEAFLKAGEIFRQLQFIKDQKNQTTFKASSESALNTLISQGFKPEYILLVNAKNFDILEDYDTNLEMRLLCAVWLEGVRLIDNIAV